MQTFNNEKGFTDIVTPFNKFVFPKGKVRTVFHFLHHNYC